MKAALWITLTVLSWWLTSVIVLTLWDIARWALGGAQ